MLASLLRPALAQEPRELQERRVRKLVQRSGLAALAGLAAFWTMQGQFRGW